MNPGDTFIIENKKGADVPFLIVLLSSDREPGIEYMQDSIYRCAQFQISKSDGTLFGAQIVLYTIPELEEMKKWDNIVDLRRVRWKDDGIVSFIKAEKHKRKNNIT